GAGGWGPPGGRRGAGVPVIVQWVGAAVPWLSPPPPYWAELPLRVQSVSVALPLLSTPPPRTAEPPVRVRPESEAVTPMSTRKTPLLPPAPKVRPAAGPVIVCKPPVSLSSIGPAVRAIVCGLAKAGGAKVMVAAAPRTSARLTAWRRLRSPGGEPTPSRVVFTISGPVWKAPMSGAVAAGRTRPR